MLLLFWKAINRIYNCLKHLLFVYIFELPRALFVLYFYLSLLVCNETFILHIFLGILFIWLAELKLKLGWFSYAVSVLPLWYEVHLCTSHSKGDFMACLNLLGVIVLLIKYQRLHIVTQSVYALFIAFRICNAQPWYIWSKYYIF
jgi:hypothetical protein